MLTRLPLRLLLRLRLPSIRSYLITSLPCTCTTHLHPHHSHSHSFSTFSDRVRGATSKKKKQPKKIHDEKKYTKQPPIEDEIDENQPALSDEPADILADEMDQVDEPDGPRGWPKYEQIQQSITYPYADIPHPFLTSLLDIWLSLNKLYLSEQHQHHPCIVVILRRHISHLLSSQTLTDSLHDLQYLHEWGQKQSPPVHVIGVDVDADAKQSQSSPKQIGSFTIHPDNTPLSQLTSTCTSIPIIPYSPHLHTFATHIHDRYQYISHPHATHLHRISNMMTSGACLMLHTFSYEWKHQQPTLFEDDIVFGLALQRYEREHDIIFTQENIHLQDDAKMENFIKQIMKERQKTQKNVGIKNEEIKDEISLIIPGLAPSVTAATLEQDMNAHGLWLDGCAGANNLTHELPRIRDVAPLQIVTDQVFFAVKVKEMKQQREDEDEDDDNK